MTFLRNVFLLLVVMVSCLSLVLGSGYMFIFGIIEKKTVSRFPAFVLFQMLAMLFALFLSMSAKV